MSRRPAPPAGGSERRKRVQRGDHRSPHIPPPPSLASIARALPVRALARPSLGTTRSTAAAAPHWRVAWEAALSGSQCSLPVAGERSSPPEDRSMVSREENRSRRSSAALVRL